MSLKTFAVMYPLNLTIGMCLLGFLPFFGLFIKGYFGLPGVSPFFLSMWYCCIAIIVLLIVRKKQVIFAELQEKYAIRVTLVFFFAGMLLLFVYLYLFKTLMVNEFLFPIIPMGDLKDAIGKQVYAESLSGSNPAEVKRLLELDKDNLILFTKLMMISTMSFSVFSSVFSFAVGGIRLFLGEDSLSASADVDV